jgi:hypothetical protein
LAMNNNIQGKYVVLIDLYAGYTKTKWYSSSKTFILYMINK